MCSIPDDTDFAMAADDAERASTMWRTSDGKWIFYKMLETPHLINILKYMIRAAESRRIKAVSSLVTARPPTADMASLAFDQELDSVLHDTLEDYLDDRYETLVIELEGRPPALYPSEYGEFQKHTRSALLLYIESIAHMGTQLELNFMEQTIEKVRKSKK